MNLTDLQSAIGRCQLSRIEEMYTHREMLGTITMKIFRPWPRFTILAIRSSFSPCSSFVRYRLPHDINRDEFVWRASNEFQVTFGVHYNSIPTFSAYKTLFNGASY